MCGCAPATSFSAPRSPFFECSPGLRLRVKGPRLLVREALASQDTRQALGRDRLAEPLLDERGEIGQRPPRGAVDLRIGPLEDPLRQKRQLAFREGRATSGARAINETRETFGVVSHDSIAKRLAFHPRRCRRIGTRHTAQRIGNRQHALRSSNRTLAEGKPPQLARRKCVADDQSSSHLRPANHPIRQGSQSWDDKPFTESLGRRAGIIPTRPDPMLRPQ